MPKKYQQGGNVGWEDLFGGDFTTFFSGILGTGVPDTGYALNGTHYDNSDDYLRAYYAQEMNQDHNSKGTIGRMWDNITGKTQKEYEENLDMIDSGEIYNQEGVDDILSQGQQSSGQPWAAKYLQSDEFKTGMSDLTKQFQEHQDKIKKEKFNQPVDHKPYMQGVDMGFGQYASGGNVLRGVIDGFRQRNPPISYSGYRDDSPDRNNTTNRIPGKLISMDNVSKMLYLKPNNGAGLVARPNSGNYEFPGADYVDEFPIMAKGGIVSNPGDPYEYTRDGDEIYTRKKGSTKWIRARGKSETAIKNNVFKDYDQAIADGEINGPAKPEEITSEPKGGPLKPGEEGFVGPVVHQPVTKVEPLKKTGSSAKQKLLEEIAVGEGMSEKNIIKYGYESAYDVPVGYDILRPDKPLSQMTLGEVKAFQKKLVAATKGKLKGVPSHLGSSAVGKYQMVASTLIEAMKAAGLTDDDLFNAENQEKLGEYLLDRRGYNEFVSGKKTTEEFQKSLSQEWASVTNPETGKSFYGDQPTAKDSSHYEQLLNDTIEQEKIQEKQQTSGGGGSWKMGGEIVNHIANLYQQGGVAQEEQGPVPIQTEKGEMLAFSDNTITPVKANRLHKNMDPDKMTDIVPEETYVFSRDKGMELEKRHADNIVLGMNIPQYKENEAGEMPEEFTLGDIFKKSKQTPADVAKNIMRQFPVSDIDDDAFAIRASSENKESRAPYIEGLKKMSEMKRTLNAVNEYRNGGSVAPLMEALNYQTGGKVDNNLKRSGNMYSGIPKHQGGGDVIGAIVQGAGALWNAYNTYNVQQDVRYNQFLTEQEADQLKARQDQRNQIGLATGSGFALAQFASQDPSYEYLDLNSIRSRNDNMIAEMNKNLSASRRNIEDKMAAPINTMYRAAAAGDPRHAQANADSAYAQYLDKFGNVGLGIEDRRMQFAQQANQMQNQYDLMGAQDRQRGRMYEKNAQNVLNATLFSDLSGQTAGYLTRASDADINWQAARMGARNQSMNALNQLNFLQSQNIQDAATSIADLYSSYQPQQNSSVNVNNYDVYKDQTDPFNYDYMREYQDPWNIDASGSDLTSAQPNDGWG